MLAIETARAGSATGEVTTVLRTLPSGKQSRVPFGIRHRMRMLLAGLLVLALAGGAAVWLGTQAHHGTGKLSAPPPSTAPTQVRLPGAQGFNPLGDPKSEHPDPGLAIDNDPNTAWLTQHYYGGNLGKAGVGLYIDARPGTAARVLEVRTKTPGWSATIYARTSLPPMTWPDPGWQRIGAANSVKATQSIPLTTGGKRFSFFLVWITSLGGHDQLALNEVTLYR